VLEESNSCSLWKGCRGLCNFFRRPATVWRAGMFGECLRRVHGVRSSPRGRCRRQILVLILGMSKNLMRKARMESMLTARAGRFHSSRARWAALLNACVPAVCCRGTNCSPAMATATAFPKKPPDRLPLRSGMHPRHARAHARRSRRHAHVWRAGLFRECLRRVHGAWSSPRGRCR